MPNSQAFELLKPDDRLRVNTVILEMFEQNQDHFINNFRKKINEINKADKASGFQTVLDNMRDTLAEELKRDPKFPKVKENGIHSTNDLGHQGQLFRAIRDLMAKEEGTPAKPYNPPALYEATARGDRYEFKDYLPELTSPYKKSPNLILDVSSAVTSNECKLVSGHSTTCPIVPNHAVVKRHL